MDLVAQEDDGGGGQEEKEAEAILDNLVRTVFGIISFHPTKFHYWQFKSCPVLLLRRPASLVRRPAPVRSGREAPGRRGPGQDGQGPGQGAQAQGHPQERPAQEAEERGGGQQAEGVAGGLGLGRGELGSIPICGGGGGRIEDGGAAGGGGGRQGVPQGKVSSTP